MIPTIQAVLLWWFAIGCAGSSILMLADAEFGEAFLLGFGFPLMFLVGVIFAGRDAIANYRGGSA